MQRFTQYLNEASLSRVYLHTQNRNVGIITAHRGENSALENAAKTANLKADIRQHGLGFIPIQCRYIEDKGLPTEKRMHEKSFLVTTHPNDNGLLKGFLKKHGEKYNQEAVLYKKHDSEDAHLLSTKDPTKGTMISAGKFHPLRIGDYYSALHGGKTFAFEFIVFINDKTWFNRTESEY